MPVVACPDCGREVSDAAPACIHCGRPARIAFPAAMMYAPPAAAPPPPARDVECPLCRVFYPAPYQVCPRCQNALAPAGTLPPHGFEHVPVSYAGVWARLGGWVMDAVILLPITIPNFFIHWRSGVLNAVGTAISLAAVLLLTACLALFERTPGKRIARVVVRRVDGGRIGWKEAFLRNLVDLAFTAVLLFAAVMTAQKMGSAVLHGTLYERVGEINRHRPGWMRPVVLVSFAWGFVDPLVLLTNRKRRAVHDFIAGTVAIRG